MMKKRMSLDVYASVLCLVMCVLVATVTATHPANKPRGENLRPIVGMLTMEIYDDKMTDEHPDFMNKSILSGAYVKFVEGAGVQVVPIFERSSKQELKKMFNRVNGLVFPGSLVSLNESTYATAATYLYKLAIEANDKGDYFPIWGVCRGFQLFPLITLGSNPDVILTLIPSAHNVSLPIRFTEEGKTKGRILKGIPKDLRHAVETRDITANFHHWSILPETFSRHDVLRKRYRVIGTSKPKTGKEFVTLFEDRLYPIYGLQFHPEKVLYEWNPSIHVNHGEDAVRFSHFLSEFFAREVRKNHHKFPSIEEENKALIYNWDPVFTGGEDQVGSPFVQVYVF